MVQFMLIQQHGNSTELPWRRCHSTNLPQTSSSIVLWEGQHEVGALWAQEAINCSSNMTKLYKYILSIDLYSFDATVSPELSPCPDKGPCLVGAKTQQNAETGLAKQMRLFGGRRHQAILVSEDSGLWIDGMAEQLVRKGVQVGLHPSGLSPPTATFPLTC